MDSTPNRCLILLLLFTFTVSASQGSRIQAHHQTFQSEIHHDMQGHSVKSRRAMIGSSAPTCTYNECRGCKHKCSAEQVPVEGNDPINSAYHYRCICHRY